MKLPAPLVTIAKKSLEELSARSFQIKVRGQIFQGLVVRKGGKFYAYQNLCQHLPITLDLNDSRFFSHDKAYLQCHMHGALYEIESGSCVAGPCQGARLVGLQVDEGEKELIIHVPEDFGARPKK